MAGGGAFIFGGAKLATVEGRVFCNRVLFVQSYLERPILLCRPLVLLPLVLSLSHYHVEPPEHVRPAASAAVATMAVAFFLRCPPPIILSSSLSSSSLALTSSSTVSASPSASLCCRCFCWRHCAALLSEYFLYIRGVSHFLQLVALMS